MHATADPDAVREFYDRIDEGEYEAAFEPIADDIAYERPGRSTLDGIEEFERFYREERSLEDGSHEIAYLGVDGNTVAVRGRFTGVKDGESVAFGFADFHRFDDEYEITDRWTYTDLDAV